jgi:uncharacterized OB-fold protein
MAPPLRTYAAPEVTPETKAFWDAAAEGRFLVKRCTACGEAHYYPRTLCPFCLSDKTEWQSSPGTGVIYSFSVMRRVPVPYAIAYVTLDEGPTMMTNIVGAEFDTIAIGQRVKIAFQPTENGPPMPVFTPV